LHQTAFALSPQLCVLDLVYSLNKIADFAILGSAMLVDEQG
jgi:hypothetical protein